MAEEVKKVVKKVVKAPVAAPAVKAPAVKKVALAKEKPKTVNVYGLDGKVARQIDLPQVFSTEYRPDLIRRAVVALQTHSRQPYGPDPMAGMKLAVHWWGKGRGAARVPRMTQGRKAAQAPGTVGGRKAHPPEVDKIYFKKINRKERQLALRSALGATTQKPLVKARGHKFEEDLTLPVVLDDAFQSLKKTREIHEALQNLGVLADLDRADDGIHIKAGKGKARGRKYRTPSSVLFVVAKRDGIEMAAKNLPGVRIVTPDHLSTEALAPGGIGGRLLLISESALAMLKEW